MAGKSDDNGSKSISQLMQKTQEIVAESTTQSSMKDSKAVKTLLRDIRGPLRAVIADGAYDDRESRDLVQKRGAKAIIPPPRNARLRFWDKDRDDAIRIINDLGGDKEAKSLWEKLTGYSRRALVETSFSRMKMLFCERLFSKTPDKQSAEKRLRCVNLSFGLIRQPVA